MTLVELHEAKLSNEYDELIPNTCSGTWTEIKDRGVNFYDIVLSTDAPVQIQTDTEVGRSNRGQFVQVLFQKRLGTMLESASISIKFSDPPAYYVGSCTDLVEFTMPPGPTRVWTVVKENEKIILLCNDVVIFDINYMTNSYRNESECRQRWDVDFEATRFHGSASDYYSQYTGGMFYSDIAVIF